MNNMENIYNIIYRDNDRYIHIYENYIVEKKHDKNFYNWEIISPENEKPELKKDKK